VSVQQQALKELRMHLQGLRGMLKFYDDPVLRRHINMWIAKTEALISELRKDNS
jgi:hypothetical protein